MLSLNNLQAQGLTIDQFSAGGGELWCLLGGNDSGLAAFIDVLSGDLDYTGELILPASLGLLSFKQQQSIFEAELKKDDTDFLDRLDPGTPARDFLVDIERYAKQIELFGLEDKLDHGYRQLSSGQARKLCILQQITAGAEFLVLENPYEGLDTGSCRELDKVLSSLCSLGLGILILLNNSADIPAGTTHLGLLAQGSLVLQGREAQQGEAIRATFAKQPPLFQVQVEDLREAKKQEECATGSNLITLHHGFAHYDGREVFSGLDLEIHRFDHTLITGPNGCGKSTLLQMITGDHPLCYVNDLTLFGKKRGSGESIWELKRKMGIVSPDLHRNHRVAGSALAIVLSGLFDTIGLYDRPGESEKLRGQRWLQRLGLSEAAAQPFRHLSYGQQRLILLARALIKGPELLILDEPTQGLDESNRQALLDFLAKIAAEQLATIVYVSHRQDEFRPFFSQQLRFHKGEVDR
ncbi:ATP-binding cassette domain-containing protein [Desulfobulbus rhabdoformis]|uniref:ATP-binding cassette domain-containing protein n=1 Tax=Desulfobulbus rhabdoformis TaxID=34032 RepID=UPI001962B3D8|nr:ATP-binding cassette domain-containing protein [Desulfobulbus rhabdoformis]MBM9615061.1 ATP-binding cassette domain-containing protein [Desulfobulbus rhabdoformis]